MSDKYIINSSTLTGIANAIRSKTGSTSAFTPSQMISKINDIIAGGTTIEPYAYQSSTITSYTSNANYILEHAFAGCTNLTTVSFPNCVFIDQDAFNGCSNLSFISAPNCNAVGSWAFYICSNLLSVSFPNCSCIDDRAFYNCSNLSTVSFPNCRFISGSFAFLGCTNLSTISFPKCSYIGDWGFLGCTNLSTASFPKCSYINYGAFQRCSKLMSLYLNQVSSVTILSDSGAFDYSPLSAGGSGKIYVPSSLYTAFISANVWSYVSARIVSI